MNHPVRADHEGGGNRQNPGVISVEVLQVQAQVAVELPQVPRQREGDAIAPGDVVLQDR